MSLAQGDLDGACYLYSIANSYFALTAKKITPAKWKASIRALPFKLDDFLSGQGTDIAQRIYDPEGRGALTAISVFHATPPSAANSRS